MRQTRYLSTPFVAKAATLAGLLLPEATGTPFANNPVTIVSSATSLSHTSPAFGGIAPGTDLSVLTYEVTEYKVTTFHSSNSSSTTSTTTTNNGGKKSTTTSTTSKSSSSTKQSAVYKSSKGSVVSNGSMLGLVHERALEETTSDIQKLESHFGTSLELNVNNLASNAAYYVMPWPSSYWAIYLDGINYRWKSASEPSATEKYASAFGLDPDALMASVSKSTGVESMAASSTSCWTNWDCASKGDGSVCARRDGEARGYCIPTWYGICHAWAPAALLEPEPNCAVDYNGVTFQPMDIKALISEVYDGSSLATVFTGARFYGPDSGDSTDEYGRYSDSSRRDIGPGFMHVALANIIGRFNASVVMDVTAGAEVWNQPIYSYKVLTQREMTPSDAANQYFQVPTYPFNNEAQRIMYVETTVSWMVETFEDGGLVSSGRASKYENSKTYKYLLELDNDYNILGGEWVEDSQSDHPDFLWLPKARPDLSLVTEVGLSYQNVRMLLDRATNCA
ncbi:hypothetical protein F442_10567 [Phytophthora nicotianae P10297]|uniref:Transglutaminase elicitor n=1 Tax=Phytophthora nicotianae P10297 TaxID=1317064 RepID=W2Z5H7_PHYNI|nr:hypothetical protein F442_10567 [Phytophthora nicotianae P10297]